MIKPELMACSACGGMVPEFDLYPYSGHTKDCPDAKEWRQACEGRLRGRDAVDDKIVQLKAKLALEHTKNVRLRQTLRDVWSSLSLTMAPATYHKIKDTIAEVLRQTGGRR